MKLYTILLILLTATLVIKCNFGESNSIEPPSNIEQNKTMGNLTETAIKPEENNILEQESPLLTLADSLVHYLNMALNSDSASKTECEMLFFKAFPNSFSEMQALFGYSKHGPAPLYSETAEPLYLEKHISSNVIGFFNELESIPPELYYEKYVNINMNGYWQADNIIEAFGFRYRLKYDTKEACAALARYTDSEIESVFKFMLDGPHPKNQHNEKVFNLLYPLINEQNSRLAALFKKSYVYMISRDMKH